MRVSPCRMSQNVCQAESVLYTWRIPQRYRLNRPHGTHYVVERAPPGTRFFLCILVINPSLINSTVKTGHFCRDKIL